MTKRQRRKRARQQRWERKHIKKMNKLLKSYGTKLVPSGEKEYTLKPVISIDKIVEDYENCKEE